MKPYIQIQPLPLCIIDPHFKHIILHIDQYNRLYYQDLKSKDYKKHRYLVFKCFKCNQQLSYFPNSIGITCTDNYCHKLWMKNLYKNSSSSNSNNNNNY